MRCRPTRYQELKGEPLMPSVFDLPPPTLADLETAPTGNTYRDEPEPNVASARARMDEAEVQVEV